MNYWPRWNLAGERFSGARFARISDDGHEWNLELPSPRCPFFPNAGLGWELGRCTLFCVGAFPGQLSPMKVRLPLFFAALSVVCAPSRSQAWQARQEITQAVIESLSPDDAIIQKLGMEALKLREHLGIPDRRDTLNREKFVWFYANDYLLFPGTTLHREQTRSGMQEDALAFFSRSLQALRTESVPNAGRWIGALLHFTEDCGSPAVAADISGDLRGKMEGLVNPKAIHIQGYQPILLGRTEVEALAGFQKRLEVLSEYSRQRAERAKPLIAAGERSKAEPMVMECAEETCRVAADILFTLGELATVPGNAQNVILRGSISGRPGKGVERVPAKVMLEGTPYSTMADEEGRYVFYNLPAGDYMLGVMRPGSVVARQALKLSPAKTAVKDIVLTPTVVKDIVLTPDLPAGNMLRDASLTSHWLKAGRPDCWYPIASPGVPAEKSWEGDVLPLRPGAKYRLQVDWQPNAPGKVAIRIFGPGGPNKPQAQVKTLAPGETKIDFAATEDTPYAQLFISGGSTPESSCKHLAVWLTGFESGEWPVCNRVRFFPAPSAAEALVGGRFEGSNTGPAEGFELLAEIKEAPPADQWGELKFDNHKIYRWLRYVGAPGSFGKIAEVEYYSGQRQLGPGGAYGSIVPEHSWQQASDQNTRTWFESDVPDGQFVGLDLRDTASAYYPRFSPEPGEHEGPLDVEIKSGPPGAVVRYTLDGTLPTTENGQIYSEPLHVEKTTTIEAVTFQEGRAPSPPISASYLLKNSVHPALSTFHVGNSLTGITSYFKSFARTAGYPHESAIYARPGAWTKELWDASLTQDKERFETLWDSLPRIDHLTLQPRDFDIAEEAGYDIRWLDLARRKSPGVQPWLYCEWTEMKRERPTDKGEVPSSQMKKLYPALTWEESMGAMMLYMEELQRKIAETDHEGKRPRVLPAALAMGWIKNMIDEGKLPGIAPGSFYPLLFNDQVHPTVNPFINENGNGGYLVDLTWFSAFYRKSPEGVVLPIGTTFSTEQSAILQRLAWDVIRNYPDCGLYEEGKKPVAKPDFWPRAAAIDDVTPVRLSSTTPGAWFRYTLDGTTPTRTTGYIYCGIISVRPGMTVKAMAYESGMADSPAAEAAYPREK
jgi:hypothetical protein